MKNTFLGLISVSILAVSCKKDEKATYLKDEAGSQQSSVAINNTPKVSLMDQAGIQANAAPLQWPLPGNESCTWTTGTPM